MRILFVKSKNIGSILIRAFEGGNASHCGIVVNENMVIDASWPKGVQIRTMNDFMKSRELVEDIIFDVPDDTSAIEFLKAQLGKKYDLSFIFSFLLWRDISNSSRWACSEMLRMAIQFGGIPYFGRPNRYGVRLLQEVCNALSIKGTYGN